MAPSRWVHQAAWAHFGEQDLAHMLADHRAHALHRGSPLRAGKTRRAVVVDHHVHIAVVAGAALGKGAAADRLAQLVVGHDGAAGAHLDDLGPALAHEIHATGLDRAARGALAGQERTDRPDPAGGGARHHAGHTGHGLLGSDLQEILNDRRGELPEVELAGLGELDQGVCRTLEGADDGLLDLGPGQHGALSHLLQAGMNRHRRVVVEGVRRLLFLGLQRVDLLGVPDGGGQDRALLGQGQVHALGQGVVDALLRLGLLIQDFGHGCLLFPGLADEQQGVLAPGDVLLAPLIDALHLGLKCLRGLEPLEPRGLVIDGLGRSEVLRFLRGGQRLESLGLAARVAELALREGELDKRLLGVVDFAVVLAPVERRGVERRLLAGKTLQGLREGVSLGVRGMRHPRSARHGGIAQCSFLRRFLGAAATLLRDIPRVAGRGVAGDAAPRARGHQARSADVVGVHRRGDRLVDRTAELLDRIDAAAQVRSKRRETKVAVQCGHESLAEGTGGGHGRRESARHQIGDAVDQDVHGLDAAPREADADVDEILQVRPSDRHGLAKVGLDALPADPHLDHESTPVGRCARECVAQRSQRRDHRPTHGVPGAADELAHRGRGAAQRDDAVAKDVERSCGCREGHGNGPDGVGSHCRSQSVHGVGQSGEHPEADLPRGDERGLQEFDAGAHPLDGGRQDLDHPEKSDRACRQRGQNRQQTLQGRGDGADRGELPLVELPRQCLPRVLQSLGFLSLGVGDEAVDLALLAQALQHGDQLRARAPEELHGNGGFGSPVLHMHEALGHVHQHRVRAAKASVRIGDRHAHRLERILARLEPFLGVPHRAPELGRDFAHASHAHAGDLRLALHVGQDGDRQPRLLAHLFEAHSRLDGGLGHLDQSSDPGDGSELLDGGADRTQRAFQAFGVHLGHFHGRLHLVHGALHQVGGAFQRRIEARGVGRKIDVEGAEGSGHGVCSRGCRIAGGWGFGALLTRLQGLQIHRQTPVGGGQAINEMRVGRLDWPCEQQEVLRGERLGPRLGIAMDLGQHRAQLRLHDIEHRCTERLDGGKALPVQPLRGRQRGLQFLDRAAQCERQAVLGLALGGQFPASVP